MISWLHQTAQWSWQNSFAAGLLAALLLIIPRLWRHRIPPRWLYVAGWLVMLRLFLPAPFTNPWAWDRVWAGPSAAPPAAPDGNPDSLRAEIASTRAELASLLSTQTGAKPVAGATDSVAAGLSPEVTAPVLEARPFDWLSLTVWIWAAGAIGYFLFNLAQHRRFLRRLSPARTSLPDSGVLAILDECARLAGLRQPPRLITVPGTGSPLLYGMRHPCIVLPSETVASLSRSELRHVLVHELLHITRRDLASNWLLAAVRALHWWNPFIHFAARRLLADRELLRDRQAIALLHDEPGASAAYGHTLLKIALPLTAPAPSPGLAPFFRTEKELKRRLLMIQSPPRRHPLAAIAGIVTLTGISLTVFSTARGQDDKKPAEPASGSTVVKPSNPVLENADTKPSPSGEKSGNTGLFTDKIEQDITRMQAQLNALDALKGEQLIAGAMELGIDPGNYQTLYPEYQKKRAEKQALIKNGATADLPGIKALDESIAASFKQMEQSAELYKANLRIRIESARKMLGDARTYAAPVVREDAALLAARLTVLNGLEGERLIAAIYALDPGIVTIGKLYPEYQLQSIQLGTLLSGGLGPKHPKIRGLQESQKVMLQQLESCAKQYVDGLALRIKVARAASSDQQPDASSAAGAEVQKLRAELADLKSALAAMRQQAQPVERSRENDSERDGKALSIQAMEASRIQADLQKARAEQLQQLAEMEKTMADLRLSSGADELRKELARLKEDRQSLNGKKAEATDSRVADIERALEDRTNDLLRLKEQLALEKDREKAMAEEEEMRARALQDLWKKETDEAAAKRKEADAAREDLPFGTPEPGKPGFCRSPYAPDKGLVDLTGYKSGTRVSCPYTGKHFRTP